ncbi:MAG: hypothetical protein HYT11_03985 [Candidatus Levybacteria bacterium]|nr:hypothetical protein [Candidatus Levybacteria bacterium]
MLEHHGLIRIFPYEILDNYIGCEGVAMIRTSPPGRKGVYAIYRGIIAHAPFVPIGEEKGYALSNPSDRSFNQVISPSDKIWVKKRI